MSALSLGERANGHLHFHPSIVDANFDQLINGETGACPTTVVINAKGEVEGQIASIDIPLLGTKTIMDEASQFTLYNTDIVNSTTQLPLPQICDPNHMPPMHEGTTPVGDKCSASAECLSTATCYQNTCVHTGALRVSAVWFEGTDLDLYLELPTGDLISWRQRRAQGGYYDFHNCTGGCSTPAPYVENIYFADDAPQGTYKVWLRQAGGEVASSFEIQVDNAGDVTTSPETWIRQKTQIAQSSSSLSEQESMIR